MFYKIVEISTAKDSGNVYVEVEFWKTKADFDANKPFQIVNSFLMQLRSEGHRIVTNENGWLKRIDGVYIDPSTLTDEDYEWEKETYTRDTPSEIRTNILAYWSRVQEAEKTKPFPQDHRDWRIERDESDSHNILTRSDVQQMKNLQEEVL